MPPTCDSCGKDTARTFPYERDDATEWRCAVCHPAFTDFEYL